MKRDYWQGFDKSLGQLIRELPREYLVKDRWRASLSIAFTLTLLIACWYATFVLSTTGLPSTIKWLAGLTLSLFTGTILTGGFDIAHDAAHRSLFNSKAANNFWGHLFSSLVGWPFHLWRHAHDIHHKYTNHAAKDIAWEPKTVDQMSRWSELALRIYKIRGNKYLYWLGGFLHLLEQLIRFINGHRRFSKKRGEIWWSLIITTATLVATYSIAFYFSGIFGVVVGLMIPQVVYSWWLATFTLLHHTTPDSRFLNGEDWDHHVGAAQLLGTVNVRYGKLIDLLTHNIAWHIPHHITVAIPHYHLPAATAYLRQHYPIREVDFSFSYLFEVVEQCQMVASKDDLTWKAFVELGV